MFRHLWGEKNIPDQEDLVALRDYLDKLGDPPKRTHLKRFDIPPETFESMEKCHEKGWTYTDALVTTLHQLLEDKVRRGDLPPWEEE